METEIWEQIGAGQSICIKKNVLGGFDVLLRTNHAGEGSSYVLLSRTTHLKKYEDRVQWE